MLQFAPTAKLVPQLFAKTNDEASAPVTAMLVMDNAAVPVLVMVTYWDALEEPTATDPKERLVADRVTGAAGATPAPESAMLCGEPIALSVMTILAVSAPATVGPKCPWMVQLAPTARLVPQLFANTNEEASVPVTAMLVMDNAPVPLLVTTTVCDALMVFTLTEPNERLVADRVTGAARPVPLSAMV